MKDELIIIGFFLLYTCITSLFRKKESKSNENVFIKISRTRIFNSLGILIGVYSLLEGFNLFSF